MGISGPAKCPYCERTELVRVGMGDEDSYSQALTERVALLKSEHPEHPAFTKSPFPERPEIATDDSNRCASVNKHWDNIERRCDFVSHDEHGHESFTYSDDGKRTGSYGWG